MRGLTYSLLATQALHGTAKTLRRYDLNEIASVSFTQRDGPPTGILTDPEVAKLTANNSLWPVAKLPSEVHLELLARDAISDPFIGLNEERVQWVGEKSWVYRFELEVPKSEAKSTLVFEGLDTIANVFIDGNHVSSSDNMYLPVRIPIDAGRRTVLVQFESAFVTQRERQNATKVSHPDYSAEVWNGDPSRVFVRKAQYGAQRLILTH